MRTNRHQNRTNDLLSSRGFVQEEAGVALIVALSFLVLFSLLGTAYVQYMSVERNATDYEILQARARTLATGGAYAAVAEIRAAIRSDQAPQAEYTFVLPVYRQKSYGIESTPHEVGVSVVDEAGRVNLNYAPRPTLEALGLSREAVRKLKSSLPRSGDETDVNRRWLASVGELVSRGIVTPAEFAQLDHDQFTVYSGSGQDDSRYVNINSAPPAVLAAVFDVTLEKATELAAQRPFASWEDAARKAGRDPAALAFSGDDAAAEANSPATLALSSRVYRIRSEAEVSLPSSNTRRVRGRVDAVVAIREQGDFVFRDWDFSTGQLAPAVEESATAAAPDTGEAAGGSAPTNAAGAPDNAAGAPNNTANAPDNAAENTAGAPVEETSAEETPGAENR